MKEPDTYDQIPVVFTRPGKKKMLILAAVFVAIIIGGIAVAVLMGPPAGGTAPPPIQGLSPSPTQPATPGTLTATTHTSRQTETQRTLVTEKKPVDFTLVPEAQVQCGLTCRALTATITNTGTETAHNVCITLVVHNSRDETISLNGAPSITRCVGDIDGGASKSEPITINADCGAFASKCIRQTLTLQTQAASDEKTVRFPDQTIAV